MREKSLQSDYIDRLGKIIKMKVAIIGAGAAGLIALKHSLDFGCEVIAFEQSGQVGGTWVYSDEVGHNVLTSMYKNLITNLPIELMSYPNEPFPENDKSFVSSEVVLSYYESFADKYNLRDYIKFEHNVLRVNPLSDNSWELIVMSSLTNKCETYACDAVLICTGHYHSSFIPEYEGRKSFKGKQMHSHYYREPKPFKDEEVLVVGGNFSAVDIVQQTSELAKSVTWSHHLKEKPDIKAFGPNVTEKPDVQRLSEETVEFADGSFAQPTVIVYCTGYEYKFPFLSVDCGINTCEGFVKPLFKHCLSINRPTLGFIGLANLICPNQVFCLQSRFCLSFMTGRKMLPSKEEMLKDFEEDLLVRSNVRKLPSRKNHLMGPDVQDVYYRDLADTSGVVPLQPVIPRMHKFTNLDRNRDFVNFRRKKFFIINDDTFETQEI